MPRAWIRLTLFSVPLLLLAGAALLFLNPRASAPQPQPIPTLLADNSETRVEITPGAAPHLYNFSSRRLKLGSTTPGFTFAAELRSADGQTVARFSPLLEEVQLTLAAGAFYQLALTPTDARQTGAVALDLGSAVIAPETLDGTAFRAADCQATNGAATAAVVRSAPGAQYALLGLLPADGTLPALGQTDDRAWYTVSFAERLGWVAGSAVGLAGDCAALPVVRNPAIPDAPADAPAFLLQVDRDGSDTFSEAISTPGGDTRDVIWVQIINLDVRPPNNYREFTLTLTCAGTGSAGLRWGSAYAPTLGCGASVVLPFLNSSAQMPIAVQFTPESHQSYVEYALSVQPAAAVG